MSEQQAIRLCLKHRDPLGFEFLVQHYKREAFYHAHALLGNEADAADACQDAFLRAFEAMPRLKTLDRFYPWFYRILRNVCLNMLDRRNTRNAYVKERFTLSDSEVVSDTPETLTVATEDRQEVWRLLRGLSSDHREILTLKYIHGFRYDEISEYTKLMAESREQALDRLRDEAVRIGADAVVGLRLTTSMITQGAAEILAYGTAVKLADE